MQPTLETTPDNKTIIRLDSSLYIDSNCPRYIWWALVMGLRQSGKDHKMEYGTAFHKAMETWYKSGDAEAAITIATNHYTQPTVNVPDTDWRTVSHLVNTIQMYLAEWKHDGMVPMVISGQPLLEQRFAYPLYSTPRTDVLLCGTIDMIAMYGGHRVIVDHKTTALTDIDGYLDSYMLSPQLMTYTWIMQRLFPQWPDTHAMINGIFLNRTGKNRFKRSPLLKFTDDKIHHHATNLLNWAELIADRWEAYQSTNANHFTPNYTCCERKYGMCRYNPLCRLDDDSLRDSVASMDFIQQTYNPLNHQT